MRREDLQEITIWSCAVDIQMEMYIVADFTYVDGELSAHASLQCGTRGAQRNAISDTTDPRLLLKWPFSGRSTHHWFQPQVK